MSPTELREVEVYFYLFMNDLPNWFTFRDLQLVEQAVLASLFLDRDQIPTKFRYIHDLIHRTPIERFNRSYTLPDHWEIPLPDQTREVSSLGLEEGTATIEDLRTLRTRSYYHIQKDELMEKVRCLLCRGLRDEMIPLTYEDIEELYDRLLNYKGAIMWKTACDQFSNNEIIFLWNRSMISQSIERAWHLNPALERVDDSIPNFKVTHHRNVRNFRDGDELIPIVETEVWTNDQLRDALGYDWMYDQNLILQNHWIDIKRETDLHRVREMLVEMVSYSSSRVTMILKDAYRDFTIETSNGSIIVDEDSVRGNLGDLLIETSYQSLYLEELNPGEMSFPFEGGVDQQLSINSDDEEKELVREEVNEQQLELSYNRDGFRRIAAKSVPIKDDEPYELDHR